jgi:nickel-dependent lactate racemase
MSAGEGSPNAVLGEREVSAIIAEGTPAALFENKRVLVLTPDATRTCPLPMMVRALGRGIGSRCAALDFMVALGTHTPLAEAEILSLYGITDPGRDFPRARFFHHRWDLPDTLRRIGTLPAPEVEALSEGLLREEVPIEINRAVFDYDLVLVLGPVFPHEVVGFSGGAKYLFPGISGGEFLHFFHWLGAVITCKKIIGVKDTPVRRVIDRAMRHVPVPVHCLAMVVNHDSGLCGLYAGDAQAAWSQAADLSSGIHIVEKEHPFRMVFGVAPVMYDEIWTAGKVMYKLEQVVAYQGTLVIYAPHIREISRTWGRQIEQAGYHVRDYFLAQMDRFRNIPRGVLAHLTHVRGTGTYQGGVERADVDVVLATGIPEEACRRVNFGYMDPGGINLSDYMGKEAEGILFVDHAGEILHRLKHPPATEPKR